MSDYNEYYKKAWEMNLVQHSEVISNAVERGYNAAIEALSTKEADSLHEMYAIGFAEWLEKKKWEVLKGGK